MKAEVRTARIHEVCPLLAVSNIDRSVEFYTERLGFRVATEARDDANKLFWCRLERDGAALMLGTADDDEDGQPGERGRGVCLYFICDEADAIHAEFTSRGLTLNAPAVAYYGMKQLFVPEPDGYLICFESPTNTSA